MLDVGHAVREAGRRLQDGLDLLRCNSHQPEAIKQLSDLARAAAEHVQDIIEKPGLKVAHQAAITAAALESKVASTAAAYFSWFTQGLLSMAEGQNSSISAGGPNNSPSKHPADLDHTSSAQAPRSWRQPRSRQLRG